MDIQVHRLNYPEYLLPLLRRETKILSLTFHQLPELMQLRSDPNLSRMDKMEILENIFSEFKSRGLDVSLQDFVTVNMLDDWMIDDEGLSPNQKQELTNSWIAKCLNSNIASLEQVITTLTQTIFINKIPTQSIGYYIFNSSHELRQRELWSQKYRPSINSNIDMNEEEEEDECMSDVQIDILEEKEKEEGIEEEEEEEEEKIQILGNKRKRQYKKTWFKTTVIPNDPKIRKKISNLKENNYWNAIAETIQPRWSHTILWRKDITDILQDFQMTSPKIDGIIAVCIDAEKARLHLKNYVLHVGRYRDILLHQKSLLPYNELINEEKVTTNIMILDKKWKILKVINNTPSFELEWIQQEYEKRPQLPMKFTPVQWD